jgi:Restriction endonuclease XhoI
MTSFAEDRFQIALDEYRVTREAQTAKQLASGRIDAGTRGSVTGGAHLHALANLLGEIFVENGFAPQSIKQKGMELPGFYRPTKNWDLVVVERGILVAAIELKSQSGSVSNNFNNRTEEAIGNALDLRRAYQAGSLGGVPPWLGYVFVLEESPKSNSPVRVASTPFGTDEAFRHTSYQDRYQILCRRLVSDGLYDAACFVTTSRVAGSRITHPDPSLSFSALQAAIADRAASVRRLLGDSDSSSTNR